MNQSKGVIAPWREPRGGGIAILKTDLEGGQSGLKSKPIKQMKLELSEVEPRDYPFLLSIRELKMTQLYVRSKFIVLAEIDGKFAGLCAARGILNVLSSEVLEEFRGQGIGKELLTRTISVARRRAEDLVLVTVEVTNGISVRNVEKRGFLEVFQFNGPSGAEKLLILPLSTLGRALVITLRLFRAINPAVLGGLCGLAQRLLSITW
jgi:GNAT superfamily N-acetyltransferase